MWSILLVLAGVVAICILQYRAAARVRRPLSLRQPEQRHQGQVPLGMEAIDLKEVNRVTRRNESLERGQTNWTRAGKGFFGATADTDIEPLPDDETYAARFYTVFQKNKPKD